MAVGGGHGGGFVDPLGYAVEDGAEAGDDDGDAGGDPGGCGGGVGGCDVVDVDGGDVAVEGEDDHDSAGDEEGLEPVLTEGGVRDEFLTEEPEALVQVVGGAEGPVVGGWV